MPTGMKESGHLRKGDERKALIAALIRWRADSGKHRMDCQ